MSEENLNSTLLNNITNFNQTINYNETLSSENITNGTQIENKDSPLFEQIIKIALIVSGGTISIAILALIIVLIIYCILKCKKNKDYEMKKLPENSISMDKGIEMDNKIIRHGKINLDFNKIQNTSLSESGHSQKVGTSLSEIRIENENVLRQSGNKSLDSFSEGKDKNAPKPEQKNKKKRKVKKDKNQMEDSPNKEKKENKEKDLEMQIQNQLGQFGFGQGDDDDD